MNRRNFLRLYGEGLADAVLLGTAGGRVLAQTGPSLNTQFEATTDYDVPKKLPLTIGYANTSWEIPPPSASSYDQDDLHGRRAHGIIQLVQKPSKDTLDRASLLTGLSKKQLKNDRRPTFGMGRGSWRTWQRR
jgi:hypothetical protein